MTSTMTRFYDLNYDPFYDLFMTFWHLLNEFNTDTITTRFWPLSSSLSSPLTGTFVVRNPIQKHPGEVIA